MNNRKVGNNAEVKYAKDLRDSGLCPECVTSRYGSRMLDDSKIDLMYTDHFAFQVKRTKQAPRFSELLEEMRDSLGSCSWSPQVPAVIWKNPKIRGKSGEYVVVNYEDFKDIFKLVKLATS